MNTNLTKKCKLMMQKKDLILIKEIIALPDEKPIQQLIKRMIDYLGALSGIIMLLPIFIIISVIIKLDSPGPIFYKQLRVGRYKKPFYMYKFRSMHINAHKKIFKLAKNNETNNFMFKMKNDPRVTKIGYFLRKYSIDEFPQLLNVIKGEMSLVGPRPPLPIEVEKYNKRHHLRLGTLPGLTGLWQVSGRSKIKCFDKVVSLDVQYIKNWNLILDFKILLKTVPVVIFGRS